MSATLALLGVGCLVAWVGATPTGATPQRQPQVLRDAGAVGVSTAVAVRQRPVRLSIPTIGLATELVRLGENADHTVQVPTDPSKAGWFDLGPPPGALGSSVILGHVDSLAGPAVFAELRLLHAGDLVAVTRADRSVVRFRVRSVHTFPNADFPSQRVYSSHGVRGLDLITCGGVYDRSLGGYQSNVVVFTRWVSTSAGGTRAGQTSN